jgi:hypothetical protein
MGDYAQDQRDEIEALESIYSEEITILGDSPHRSGNSDFSTGKLVLKPSFQVVLTSITEFVVTKVNLVLRIRIRDSGPF